MADQTATGGSSLAGELLGERQVPDKLSLGGHRAAIPPGTHTLHLPCKGATARSHSQSFSRGWVSSKVSILPRICQGCTPAAMPRFKHTQHHETAQKRPLGTFPRLGMAMCTSARAGSPGEGDGTTKQMPSPWPPPSPSWRSQEPGESRQEPPALAVLQNCHGQALITTGWRMKYPSLWEILGRALRII